MVAEAEEPFDGSNDNIEVGNDAADDADQLDVSDGEPLSEAELEIEEAYQKALDALQGLQWPGSQEGDEGAAESADAQGADTGTNGDVATEVSAESVPESENIAPDDTAARLTPRQIVEAALFVGGGPLPTRKLGGLLGSDNAVVERTIDDLNAQYLGENRPYEIHLVEGGYQLGLHAEYEPLRNRVHGVGPREVRLSQDALEILALVAYRQPISPADVEACGKKQAGNILRQLLRRELIALQRVDKSRQGIRYLTTPRFLQLFGLRSLADLPQADELSMR